SGRNATDHTGRPGPTKVRASLRPLRSITATEPRMPAAATSAPSADTATEMIGVDEACSSAFTSPAALRKYTMPLAPAATISPSPATATPESGVGNVTMVGAEPSSGQMRKVKSYAALTTDFPSGVNTTPLTFW